MRVYRGAMRLLCTTAVIAAVTTGCSDRQEDNQPAATPAASKETVAESTARPPESYVFELNSGKYYEYNGKLYEMAGYVKNPRKIKLHGGETISMEAGCFRFKFHDYYYNKEKELVWKVKGKHLVLTSKNSVYRGYRNLVIHDGVVLNLCAYYEDCDGELYFVNCDGVEMDQGTSVRIRGSRWQIATTPDVNLKAKEDKKGRVYYEGVYVRCG